MPRTHHTPHPHLTLYLESNLGLNLSEPPFFFCDKWKPFPLSLLRGVSQIVHRRPPWPWPLACSQTFSNVIVIGILCWDGQESAPALSKLTALGKDGEQEETQINGR